MAAAKKVPLSKKKFNLSNPKIALAVLFVIAFGALGVYKLLSSTAATGPTAYWIYDYEDLAPESVGVTVQHDGSNPPNYGQFNTMKLAPGGVLKFKYGNGWQNYIAKTCYVIRQEGSPAKVEIVSVGTSRQVYLNKSAATGGLLYSEYCVQTNPDVPSKDYAVKHISGGPVYVYQRSRYNVYPLPN